jgi:hypothetical protein
MLFAALKVYDFSPAVSFTKPHMFSENWKCTGLTWYDFHYTPHHEWMWSAPVTSDLYRIYTYELKRNQVAVKSEIPYCQTIVKINKMYA